MTTGNHLDVVIAVRAMLDARGQHWNTNEDAFEITGRVAWILRNLGAQLILKSSAQNGARITGGPLNGRKVSHDALAFPDGWVDCLISAGPRDNLNRPAWSFYPTGPAVPGSTAAPFDLESLAAPPPVVDDPPVSDPPVDVPTQTPVDVAALAFQLAALVERVGTLSAQVEDMALKQQRGLRGTFLGYTITLTPPPPPKGPTFP